ncbi:hypothetical protein ACI65C_003579 [Semiaphis heraclei]
MLCQSHDFQLEDINSLSDENTEVLGNMEPLRGNSTQRSFQILLGGKSCRYSGFYEELNILCHKDVVKVHKLPEECESFVFKGVTCSNADYNIMTPTNQDLEYLQSLINFKDKSDETTPVFIFYTRASIRDWYNALFHGNHALEAQKVKQFVSEHAVKGLILDGIDGTDLYTAENFYQQLTNYIKTIKTINLDLSIGFYLSARNFSMYNTNMPDFSQINGIFDFFLFDFLTFNDCTDDLLRGGITPDQSPDPNILSLTDFITTFNLSIIDPQKVVFEFLISPKPKNEKEFKPCEISYNKYCEHYKDLHSSWCIDDNEILYKKGQFARKYSKGFVASYIDLVDRENKCNCDDKYITFSILSSGYEGGEAKTCDALKIA